MGEIITKDGFKPDQSKVFAIQKFPKPQNKEDLQQLLGMNNFLGKYIPNLSDVTQPLRSLLNKTCDWQWKHEHEWSLQNICHALTTKPVLKYFNVDKNTIIQVDASLQGLGACILQEDHPICYASRTLTSAEKAMLI
jgi:hypothetical protein